MTHYRTIAVALTLVLVACAGPGDKEPAQPPPERVLLHYDFSDDWMATAGDHCAERLELSEEVFLTIGASPQGEPDRYHIANSFMLEPGEPADALVGTADGEVQLAAAEGLANFPNAANDGAISAAAKAAGPRAKTRVDKARVRLAETLRNAGDKSAARRIYESIRAGDAAPPQKRAANIGLEALT